MLGSDSRAVVKLSGRSMKGIPKAIAKRTRKRQYGNFDPNVKLDTTQIEDRRGEAKRGKGWS